MDWRSNGHIARQADRLPRALRAAMLTALVDKGGVKPNAQFNWMHSPLASKGKNDATGNLLRSPQPYVKQTASAMIGGLGLADYWSEVEFGTPPHMVPITTPEGGGLLRWVQAKHLADGASTHRGRPSDATGAALKMSLGMARRIADGQTKAGRKRQAAAEIRLQIEDRFERMRGGKIASFSHTGRELEIAHAVQRAIAKHGTKPYNRLYPAIDDALPVLMRELADIAGGRI